MPTKTASPSRARPSARTRKPAKQPARPTVSRRLPVGAEVVPEGVHFRVWAPKRKTVEVVFEGPEGDWPVTVALSREKGGSFSASSPRGRMDPRR